jgi:hypothetical protein
MAGQWLHVLIVLMSWKDVTLIPHPVLGDISVGMFECALSFEIRVSARFAVFQWCMVQMFRSCSYWSLILYSDSKFQEYTLFLLFVCINSSNSFFYTNQMMILLA